MLNRIRSACCAMLVVCFVSSAPVFAGECDPVWSEGLAGNGPLLLSPGAAGVNCAIVFDDGTGPALYIGGDFQDFNGVPGTRGIARWDGSSWSSVGGGLDGNGRAQDFAIYDDGTGPALFVGGQFAGAGGVANTNGVARWDGSSWSPAQSGTPLSGAVFALEVANLNNGEGTRLYAAGQLGSNAIRKLDLNTGNWVIVGTTNNGGTVWDLQAFTEAGVSYLFAGGSFTTVNSSSRVSLARYDGTTWSSAGNTNAFGTVFDLHVHDDGNGPALYAGGLFTSIGSVQVSKIAKRVANNNWQALGAGIGGPQPCPSCQVLCWSMATFDDGSGPALYAAGNFSVVDGQPIYRLAKWKDGAWSAVGSGPGGQGQEPAPVVRAMTTFNGCGGLAPGAPEVLFLVGKFETMNGIDNKAVAQLSACSSGVLGDLNGDGAVDLDDLNLVLTNFGQATGVGDVDGNCFVDLDDLNIVLTNFGVGS